MGQKVKKRSALVLTRQGKVVAALVVVALLLALAGAWGVPRLLDRTRLGRTVAGELANATGQRVRLEGAVRVSFLPRPRLTVYGIKFLAVDGQSVALDIPQLELDVGPASLFGGRLSVAQARLVNPHFYITRTAEGVWSWLPAPSHARTLSLWHARVEGGALSFQTGPSLPPEDVTGVEGDVYLSPSLPLPVVSLKGMWRKAPLSLDFDVATPTGHTPSPASLKVVAGAVGASFLMTGTLETTNPGLPLRGEVEVKAEQVSALLAAGEHLGWMGSFPGVEAVFFRQPLTLTATLEGQRGSYTLEQVTARLGRQAWMGTARIQTRPRLGISLAAETGPLILAGGTTYALSDLLRTGKIHLPPAWLGAFDLSCPSVTVGQVTAKDVRVKGEVTGGLLRVSDAQATLAGQSRLTASGTLATKADAPAEVDSVLSLDTVHLRELIGGLVPATSSLALVLAALPPEALQQVKLTTSVRGPWGQWGVPAIQATVDGSMWSGQISPPGKDGLFNVRLSADLLDVARYASLTAAPPAWLWALPPSQVDLLIKQLRVGDQSAQNVAVQATLHPRQLTLSTLDTDDFGGNRVRLAGTVTPEGTPGSDLTLHLTTKDFARLSAAFPPALHLVPAAALPFLAGDVDMSARWKTTADSRQYLQSLSAGDSKLDLVTTYPPPPLPAKASDEGGAKDGEQAEAEGEMPESWKIRVRHPETARVLESLAPLLLSRSDAVLGPADFYAAGHVTPEGHWRMETVQGQVAGLTVRSGTLEVVPTRPLQINGALTVARGNLDLWRDALSPLPLANLVQGAVDFTLERVTLLDDPLTAGRARLVAGPEEGSLSLESLSGTWREGTLSAKGRFSPNADPPFKADVDLQNVAFAFQAGERFGLSGQLDFSTHLETGGVGREALMRRLEGDGSFALQEGSVSGLDVATLARELKPRKPGTSVASLFARGGQSPLSSLSGSFSISEGVAKSTNLRLTTPEATAEGTGVLDLLAPRLDSTLQLIWPDLAGAPPAGVTLAGGLKDVGGTFNLEALAGWLQAPAPAAGPGPGSAQGGVEAGKSPPPAKEGVKPPEEPIPPKAEDLTPASSVAPSPTDTLLKRPPINRPRVPGPSAPGAAPEKRRLPSFPSAEGKPGDLTQPLSMDELVRRISPIEEAARGTTAPLPRLSAPSALSVPTTTDGPRAAPSATPRITFEPSGAVMPKTQPTRVAPSVPSMPSVSPVGSGAAPAPNSLPDIIQRRDEAYDKDAPPASSPEDLMKKTPNP